MDCIFCKIIAGEIPCDKLYENEHVFVFLDIAPISPGHTLVVPKHHCRNIYDMPEQVLKDCAIAIKKTANAIRAGMKAEGMNIGMNNEAIAGQAVFHAHFHVIPRYKGDGLTHWINGHYEEGEKEDALKKIKEQFQ